MGLSGLDRERHVKYWKRCLKSLLPTGYTANDSSRMTLGFFILSALDLLGEDLEILPEKERANIRDWILRCQHPNGGFCGSPNHRYPDRYYVDVGHGKQLMDPANLPATHFAILSLSFVGGLDRVRRLDCLRWLKTLQRDDGSFGELITAGGVIEGPRDMRYCYVATAIRWILRGDQLIEEQWNDDIDVQKLVDHSHKGQTYDGGISESSKHEAHAGYTYCAIASLRFLNQLQKPSTSSSSDLDASNIISAASPSSANIPAMVRWLVSRQIGYNMEEDEDESVPQGQQDPEAANDTSSAELTLEQISLRDSECVGFNGRCNKPADTCYAFWAGASLDMIGQEKLLDPIPIRRFLFEQTQHRIGGFGKTPGSPPDIYHSYMGLAALATLKEPCLKPFDPVLCVSIQQRERINTQRKDALIPTRTYWNYGYSFPIRKDDANLEKKLADSEDAPKFTVGTSI